ncbi:hydroxymethylbilane synthase [Microbacterium sp. LRZ72]|uniref:hydroxymethylbilane synthase n=1 Tax=Microbacterium sp. LRZ72 TaxID=2942481 RepID=UPI0029B11A07|nr:hydroxymethylbilane synthase [Microbacterium sp. LRZ72]MDX2376415.1 hydroxymethylbilane synthase [Microbacterium sp. LRZ72]
MTLRLGTRRSALATAQSAQVAKAITDATGTPVELVPIVSEGDVSRASLSQIGGTGVFATRLREALAAGECDLLVHSLKDLPTQPAPGLSIAAVPPRADARDIVATRGPALIELGEAAEVGTGSPRRIAQLRRRAPRATPRDIRGNVESRLGRVRDGELAAVVLAAAGLARAGIIELPAPGETLAAGSEDWAGLRFEALGLAEWPTAAGQGALAVEIREDASEDVRAAVSVLEHEATRIAVTIERSLLAGLEAGCHSPVGVHAVVDGDEVRVRAVVYGVGHADRVGLDLTESLTQGYIQGSGDGEGANVADSADPTARAALIGSAIARRLLEEGAADLVSRESAS